MRPLLLLYFLVFSLLSSLPAQDQSWPLPCGSNSGRSPWLKAYQKQPQAFLRSSDTIIYVPLTIHLLGTDQGSGFFSMSRLKAAFCKLNQDFEQTNIQFFIAGEINYIANSAWNNHETVLEGADMMFANNVPNTLNIYFVSSPAGNCGYNLPYAGIAMNKSCSGPNDNTWAHEIGHAFRLPHPFLGWEGGVSYDGSISHNFGTPAPEIVTYNYTYFKDTLIRDTLIIDTAYVERMDGSNCAFAADGFCDTAPDYLAQRWFCDGNGESPQLQTDPDGVTFRSDGSLTMGYANDACQSRFTEEQIAAMRANLYDEKPELVSTTLPLSSLGDEAAELLLPEEGSSVQFDEVTLAWEAVPNADQYVVQVSFLPTFSIQDEYVTENLTLPVSGLVNNRTYYWRVSALNAYDFCAPVSAVGSFTAAQINSTASQAGLSQARIFPQPGRSGASLSLELQTEAALSGQLSLWQLSGQVLWQQPLQLAAGRQLIELPTAGLPAGVYFLRLQTTQGTWMERVILQ